MRISALLYSREKQYGVELWIDSLEAYEKVYPLKDEFNNICLLEMGLVPVWDTLDESKKSRHVFVKKDANFDEDDWTDMYQWIMEWMFKLRELAFAASAE